MVRFGSPLEAPFTDWSTGVTALLLDGVELDKLVAFLNTMNYISMYFKHGKSIFWSIQGSADRALVESKVKTKKNQKTNLYMAAAVYGLVWVEYGEEDCVGSPICDWLNLSHDV